MHAQFYLGRGQRLARQPHLTGLGGVGAAGENPPVTQVGRQVARAADDPDGAAARSGRRQDEEGDSRAGGAAPRAHCSRRPADAAVLVILTLCSTWPASKNRYKLAKIVPKCG